MYGTFAKIVPHLTEEKDYTIDEKRRAVSITESGIEKVERQLGISNIYAEGGVRYVHHLEQALEAKEEVKVEQESKTLGTITFQNYFRMYQKLAGMTGTAKTSAEEFHKVYNLDVIVIPTNKAMIRTDYPDRIY